MLNIRSLGTDYLRWKLSLIDIVLLAFALGIDCLVASFSHGLCFKDNRIKNALTLAFFMGLFQGLLPIIGYIGIDYIEEYVEAFADWIVFAIFLILGLKFIFEAFVPKEQPKCVSLKNAVALGIATSIDALVSGVSLNFADTPLFVSCVIIGLVSFLMSISGFFAGNTCRFMAPKYLEIFGGLILIFLAVKSIIY